MIYPSYVVFRWIWCWLGKSYFIEYAWGFIGMRESYEFSLCVCCTFLKMSVLHGVFDADVIICIVQQFILCVELFHIYVFVILVFVQLDPYHYTLSYKSSSWINVKGLGHTFYIMDKTTSCLDFLAWASIQHAMNLFALELDFAILNLGFTKEIIKSTLTTILPASL